MRSPALPPYPAGSDDLRIHPVVTIGQNPTVSVDAWTWVAALSLAPFTGDVASAAPDDSALPVVSDGKVYTVTLSELLHPDADVRDISDALRGTLAAAASCAAAAKQYTAAATRLLDAPAARVDGTTP